MKKIVLILLLLISFNINAKETVSETVEKPSMTLTDEELIKFGIGFVCFLVFTIIGLNVINTVHKNSCQRDYEKLMAYKKYCKENGLKFHYDWDY